MILIKINIIAIGKDKDQWVANGSEHYLKLLSRYANIEFKIITNLKNSSSHSPAEIKKLEAKELLKHFDKAYNIALCDSGHKFESLKFAVKWQKILQASQSRINFIIGGPFGLDEELLSQADLKLSLSPMTFSHQIVRLVLLEQIYRAFSIINNTDYHK